MSAAVPPHKKIPIIREVYMDLNDKKVKTIQVIPSNKYYSILETDMDDEKYYTYRIIDAVGVVVYENLDTIVGGFNTQVESIGCGMEFPEILMGNLRDILFAEDVEKFILYDEMMFDMEVDTDLIEQRIYERQALLCRYRYLLARARELGLHTVLTRYQPMGG